jgi:opacity protein-like surface antigen
MPVFRRLTFAAAFAAAGVAGIPGGAFAQRSVGEATSISRDVSGLLAGRDRRLTTGDGVFADETIRTAAESAASLRFLDSTTLAVGPSASVKLDRFVFNPDATARSAVVSVGRGAFRWSSGNSAPRAYEVRTPTAVIGVRGTSFDLVVEALREVLVLREGVIRACLIATGRCLTLTIPGQAAIITRSGITLRGDRAQAPQVFAQRCLSGGGPSCTTETPFETVALVPPVRTRWTGGHIGVHVDGVINDGSTRYDGSPSVRTSIALGNVPARAAFDDRQFRLGFNAGLTLQQDRLVFGIDADVSFLDGRSRSVEQRVIPAPRIPIIVTSETRSRQNYLATLRPRVGALVTDDLLLYLTGGLAFGGVDIRGDIGNTTRGGGIYAGRKSTTQTGWVAGFGAELALVAGFSVRAEYLHYDLGSATARLAETTGFTAPGDPAPFASAKVRTRGDLLRVGLTRRF